MYITCKSKKIITKCDLSLFDINRAIDNITKCKLPAPNTQARIIALRHNIILRKRRLAYFRKMSIAQGACKTEKSCVAQGACKTEKSCVAQAIEVYMRRDRECIERLKYRDKCTLQSLIYI